MFDKDLTINYTSHYLPKLVVNNQRFKQTGVTGEEIVAKTGIKERRWTFRNENTNTMALESVKNAITHLPYPIGEIDLIIGATYTPYDTAFSLSHAVQNYFKIPNARCFTISSACCSFINAVEIADSYLKTRKASKILIICSENNSVYSNPNDEGSGFLWGDGAAAAFISNNKYSENDLSLVDISSKGLVDIEKSGNSLSLKPTAGGLKTPNCKDFFQHACKYMISETTGLLERNEISVKDLNYFIPHQSSKMIIDFVKNELKLTDNQVITNVEKLGNTGSPGTLIALSQNWNRFKYNDTIAISAIGGGYSCGTMLLKNNNI